MNEAALDKLLELRGELYDRYWNNTRGLNESRPMKWEVAQREATLELCEWTIARIDRILEAT